MNNVQLRPKPTAPSALLSWKVLPCCKHFRFAPFVTFVAFCKTFWLRLRALRIRRISRFAADFGTKMKMLKTESFSTSTLQERFWDDRPISLIHPLITDYLRSATRYDTPRHDSRNHLTPMNTVEHWRTPRRDVPFSSSTDYCPT